MLNRVLNNAMRVTFLAQKNNGSFWWGSADDSIYIHIH